MSTLITVIALIMTTVTTNGSGVSQTVTYHTDVAQCEAVRTYLESHNRVVTQDKRQAYSLVKTGQCVEVQLPGGL